MASKNEAGADLTQTSEFRAAVAAAVADQLADSAAEQAELIKAQVLSELSVQREKSGAAQGNFSDNMQFAEMIALAIGQMADQGRREKKYVDPAILKSRLDAHERMIGLIIEAKASGQSASYHVLNKTYLGEIMIDPVWIAPDRTQRQTEIDWEGPPNLAMRPINDTAKAIHAAFLESIGSVPKVVQEARTKVTPGGLVVKDGRDREILRQPGDVGSGETGDGLKIKGRNAGAAKLTNVLGTVAQPAVSQV